MECTWHKFLISAPGTNFQTVHPAQICMECTWYKFARSALGTNSEICKPGTDFDTWIIIFTRAYVYEIVLEEQTPATLQRDIFYQDIF